MKIMALQACKERFQELQKRNYCSGSSTAWFDELRKRRVADLKQQLAKSENSIGSLESKIKYLEVDKQYSTESRLPALDSEATESMSKQTSNDANSINGSFTKTTDRSSDKFVEMGYGHCVIMRKKQSQRKRKQCNQGTGSSNVVSTTAPKGTSTTINENEITRICGTITRDKLIQIFKSIAQSEAASVFKHRMDSQKRARYRRVIKQHMDIGTIRSRMTSSGQSVKEVFRDLLLVANNALVFYSRRTREYKSAVSLRVLVMKEYKNLFVTGYCCNPPLKPRTAPPPPPPPCKHNSSDILVPAADTTRTRLGPPEKQCNNKKVINYVSKGLRRPGKILEKPLDPPPKTIPLKQTKRLRR